MLECLITGFADRSSCDDEFECFRDVFVVSRRGFCEHAIPFLGKRFAFLQPHLSTELGWSRYSYTFACVDLICFQRDIWAPNRFPVISFASPDKYCVIQNFIPDYFDHFQRRPRGHGIYQQISMNSNRMSRVQDAIFILRSFSAICRKRHTCPAVSIISVVYSCPLYFIVLEKVFSIVG